MSTCGLVLCVILTMLSRRSQAEPLAAGHQHRRLRDAADQLVRAGDHGVGAGRHGVERQGGCRSAGAAPTPGRRRTAGRRRGRPRRCASSAAQTPLLLGETTNTALASGCASTAAATRSAGTFRGMPQTASIVRLDVVGHGAREDQRGLHRLVRVARQDDAVAGARQREQQGVQAAGRAVHEEEAALAAPGLGGQVFGGAHQRRRLARVLDPAGHGDVDGEQGGAEGLAHDRRRALAELVARRVEGHDAALAVAEQRVDVGGGRLVAVSAAAFSMPGLGHASVSPGLRGVSAGGRLGKLTADGDHEGGDHKSRPDGESALRAEPHGHAAHRLGAHRALQLPVRPPRRRQLRRAHRGHRRGALRGALRARHPRRSRLARSRLGRGARSRRPVRRPTARPSAPRLSAGGRRARSPAGHAYPCFCSQERLDALRAEALAAGRPPRYDGRCRRLDAGEVARARRRRRAGRAALCRARGRRRLRRRHPRPHHASAARRSATSSSCAPTASPSYNFAAVVDDARHGHHPRHPRRRPPHQHRPPGAAAPGAARPRRRRSTPTTP